MGKKLRELSPTSPVWIVMSPANEPVIRKLWETRSKSADHLTGITGMKWVPADVPEITFLYWLETIDLHHGPESTISSLQSAGGSRSSADARDPLCRSRVRFRHRHGERYGLRRDSACGRDKTISRLNCVKQLFGQLVTHCCEA